MDDVTFGCNGAYGASDVAIPGRSLVSINDLLKLEPLLKNYLLAYRLMFMHDSNSVSVSRGCSDTQKIQVAVLDTSHFGLPCDL